MAFNITEFSAGLASGGARNSLFQVEIQNPINGIADLSVPLLCKAASIPPSTLTPIEVAHFGRKVKLAGNRTYAQWDVTIFNDEDFAIRNALEEWTNSINSFEGNLRKTGSSSPTLYKSQAQVTHFAKDGTALRIYQFIGLFPTEISPIELNWEGGDVVEEFTCTFQYDYWKVSGGITGNAGGT